MENRTLYKALEKSRGRVVSQASTFQVGTECGRVYNCINLSTPVTFIIKEVGRLCDDYASDAFYDLKRLFNDLEGEGTVLLTQNYYQWVIGIRDYGCDHDNFIDCALRENYDLEKRYRAIYEIAVTPNERWKDEFDLKVYRIYGYSLKRNYDELKEQEITA